MRQHGFGEVGEFVDTGDGGATVRDVVGAPGGDFGDLVGEVAVRLDEPAARLDGLEVLPGPLREPRGEVLDEPRPAGRIQHPAYV